MNTRSISQTMGRLTLAAVMISAAAVELYADQTQPPQGFTALFDGQSLSGWWGATTEDPRIYLALPPDKLAEKKAASLDDIKTHWRVENAELVNDGHGLYLTTDKMYGDFELLLEYKTVPKADSGVYLRGVPQVQIWDFTNEKGFANGADKGSGGLWNNPAGAPGKDPLVLADKPLGQWNAFRILMVGERVSVWLNSQMVVDHARMHNYFDLRDKKLSDVERRPTPKTGPIQLQTHGGEIRWRNLFIREIPSDEANAILASKNDDSFESVFNGKDFSGWKGDIENYTVDNGHLMCQPEKGGTVFTEGQYGDFAVRLEFQLPPGGNNGLAIRYHGRDPAPKKRRDGTFDSFCELQVLDDGHPKYNDPKYTGFYNLNPRQAHGSVYARIPAHRGYLRPTGQWNFQESTIIGSTVKVELNGSVILEADVAKADPATFMYKLDHFPGREAMKGHFGFNGHSDPVRFRNIRIKKLD